MKQARFLCFKYSNDYPNKAEAQNKIEQLEKTLTDNNIEFYTFDKDIDYYSCTFYVLRGVRKWNDIMRIINSVKLWHLLPLQWEFTNQIKKQPYDKPETTR